MHIKIFLDQLKRSKKTLFFALLLVLVTAFFVTSVNLYQNSSKNLQQAEETYSTLAVTELYGDVDKLGNLVPENSESHVGYKAVAVPGYDIRDILDSEAVESWDLRIQYGAVIEGHPALNGKSSNGIYSPRALGQLLRFKIKSSQPVTLSLTSDTPVRLKLEVLADAAGCFRHGEQFIFECMLTEEEVAGYGEQIQRVNRSERADVLILHPEVEYVLCTWPGACWQWSEEPGILELYDGKMPVHGGEPGSEYLGLCYPWNDYGNFRVEYDADQEELAYDEGYVLGSPFPVQRWEDVQNDPALKAYYDKAWKDVGTQHYVYQVQLTGDITSIPAYHIGGASLSQGRLITAEEYESGAMVCMVSQEQADFQNWKVGDKLPIKLFETFYQPTGRFAFAQPVWDSDEKHFIHEAEYEIVGLYAKNPVSGNSGISPNTLDMSIFNIYLPENSVPNALPLEERPVHGSLFSVKLKNGSISSFLDDMERQGLCTEQPGRFDPKFTFYDQGYSLVEPGLRAMNGSAKLLLLLSSILLLVVCVLLAYFFWQNQRQSVGIFRLLGGTKKQAIVAVLLCALLLCGGGMLLGGGLGYGVAELMGQKIVEENFSQSSRDSLFQANVLPVQEGQENPIQVTADPLLTLGASAGTLLFPLLVLGFLAKDIHKEPRELLPKEKV